MKLLKVNIDVNLHDFVFGNAFLDIISKVQATNKLDTTEKVKKKKTQHTEWRKIFENDIS